MRAATAGGDDRPTIGVTGRALKIAAAVTLISSATLFQAVAGQYALAFWREAGSAENAGNHSAHLHVWDENGQPLAGKQIYTSWGVLLGATDSDGYTEIVLVRPNGYDFQIRDGANSTETTPVLSEERSPNPGHYSFEIGFIYKQNAASPLAFDTNALGIINGSGADLCGSLDAPHTRSLAYYSTASSNYCSDAYALGNYVTAHGQSFVASGNRVIGMKAQMAVGGGGHFNWTVQVLADGPNGVPVGPPKTTRTLVDSEYYQLLVTWGVNEVQVTPGHAYYYRITRAEGMNAYRVTQDNYAAGSYFENDVAMPGLDLMGLVLCGTYTNSSPAGMLTGFVRDPNSQPVSGVRVTVIGPNLYGITEADGSYRIPYLSPGTYTVSASKTGYIGKQNVGVPILVSETTVLEFTDFTPQPANAGSVAGLVLDLSGRPVAGARVSIYPANSSVVSDGEGHYTFPAIYFGNYRLVASRPGFASSVTNGVAVTNGQNTIMDLVLAPALLRNGNFEDGFSNATAEGWKRFTMAGGNGAEYVDEGSSRLGGFHAQRWWTSYVTHHAGVYQQVPVISNATYTFTAWTWRSDSFNNGGVNQEMWVGLDPYGGTNAGAANVIWSPAESSFQTWTRQGAATVARSNVLTVFVRGRADYAGQAMQSVVDDCALSGPAAFPPGLTAAAGNARVDLAWYPAASGSSYTVKRSLNRGGPYTPITAGLTTNRFTDLNVTNGLTYEYVIAAAGPDSPPVLASPSGNRTIMAAGSVWKYLDTGANLGTAWRSPAFDDSPWPAGPAQLGFGDGDEATLIASNRQITTYFRRSFSITNRSLFTNVVLRVLRDDGAVVYLNGIEVFRSNMPGGVIDYLAPASASVPSSDETTTFYTTNLSVNLFLDGPNVFAAEVHQNSATSSDLSFDLALEGQLSAAPPSQIAFARTASGLSLRWLNSGALALHSATNLSPPVMWSTVPASLTFSNGQWSATLPLATNGARFFRLQEQ